MILVTALLRLLRSRYGRPCHIVGAGAWNPDVLAGNPDVEVCWTVPRHMPLFLSVSCPRILAALHRTAPGPIYVAECAPRPLARIKRLLAFSGIDHRRVLHLGADPGTGDVHWVDCLLRLGARTPDALRIEDYPMPSPSSDFAPRLHVQDEERAARDAWLAARGWRERPLILIQPGNRRSMSKRREQFRRLNSDDKAWPIEQWTALLGKLHAQVPEAMLLLCGSSEEVPMLEEIRAAARLDAVAVAALALRPMFALLELAHSMISTDTGPAHAAAALGLPLVVIYGANPASVWLPRSPTGSPVLGVGGPPACSRVDQVPVQAVFDAWCRLLKQLPESAPDSSASSRIEPAL